MAVVNAVGNALTGSTGSGSFVGATSPTLVTPVLGAATGTTLAFSPTTGGIIGTTTNDNTSAGNVGEIISSTVSSGSAVALTTVTAANVTSISLTAGDWNICFELAFVTASSTSLTDVRGAAWNVSATLPSTVGNVDYPYTIQQYNAFVPGVTTFGFGGGAAGRLSLSGTTTIYLVARGTFTVSTLSVYGSIWARRAR